MNWEFEHWDDGKVYLHLERWENFYRHVMQTGYGRPHDWDHARIFCRLHTPRDSIFEIPVPGDPDLKHLITSQDDRWSVIYEPFPAFVRSEHDPEGWLPSWHLWAEDAAGDPSSQLTILKTGNVWHSSSKWTFLSGVVVTNTFASFQGKVWLVDSYKYLGLGAFPPSTPPPKKSKKPAPRSIFDDFQSSW